MIVKLIIVRIYAFTLSRHSRLFVVIPAEAGIQTQYLQFLKYYYNS